YRIDERHRNSFTAWKRMGSPKKPTAEQYTRLQDSAQLSLLTSPQWLWPKGGKRALRLKRPRQAVALVAFTWEATSKYPGPLPHGIHLSRSRLQTSPSSSLPGRSPSDAREREPLPPPPQAGQPLASPPYLPAGAGEARDATGARQRGRPELPQRPV